MARTIKENKVALGIDCGGTKTALGLVNAQGKILVYKKIKTLHFKTGFSGINWLIGEIKNFLFENNIKQKNLLGIGMGIAGIVDFQQGVFVDTSDTKNLKNWSGLSAKKILERRFKKSCFIDNDVNIALLGEQWKGKAKNKRNVIMLTIGTGVGGAILIEGKLYRGARGFAGEFGFTKIADDTGRPYGKDGYFEFFTSGKVIQYKAKKDSEILFKEAEKGNEKSMLILEEVGTYLGRGTGNLIEIFDPEIVIIGGGLVAVEKYIKKSMNKEVSQFQYKDKRKNIKIIFSSSVDKMAILGGAKLVFDHVKHGGDSFKKVGK